jgi:hypothetical protein
MDLVVGWSIVGSSLSVDVASGSSSRLPHVVVFVTMDRIRHTVSFRVLVRCGRSSILADRPLSRSMQCMKRARRCSVYVVGLSPWTLPAFGVFSSECDAAHSANVAQASGAPSQASGSLVMVVLCRAVVASQEIPGRC